MPGALGSRRPRRAVGLSPAIGIAIVAAFLAAFCLLLDDVVGREQLASGDGRVASWLAAHRAGWLTWGMRTITELGTFRLLALPLLALAAYLATRARRPDAAVLLAVASAGTWLLVIAVKLAVARARPEVGQMLIHTDGYSFPSGHAAQGVTTYGTLAHLAAERAARRRWRFLAWAAAMLVAGLIGFSRLYLGVHWLTDVLAGWALGTAGLALLITTASACRRVRPAAPRGGPGLARSPEPGLPAAADPPAELARPAEPGRPASERETVRLW